MTRGHKRRLASHLRAQRAAAAMRDQPPILALPPVDRALVRVLVGSIAPRGSVNAPCIAASPDLLRKTLRMANYRLKRQARM